MVPPEFEESLSIQMQERHAEQPEQRSTRRVWWRSTAAGYGFAFPIVAAAIGLTLLGDLFLARFSFPSTFLLVAILGTAFGWGVGPGLLATFISCAALLSFYLLPFGNLGQAPLDWELFFQIVPFAAAGLIVAVITGQREAARRRALRAMQLAGERAERLAVTNEELQHANQLKDFFLSVASHELKTPITTIRGQAQLALRRLKRQRISDSHTEENLRDIFTRVDEQTRRLTDLVDDLLELSSLRSGKTALDMQPCDLSEICTKVVEEQRLLSGRSIELTLPSSPVQLQADAFRLGQVMTNLVNNALKYSSSASPVWVTVTCENDTARVGVRDAGPGIPPEQLADIFKPFYRTSDARASTVRGTGLGLAICKDIIDQHQGHIWCESRPGSGSTFFIELPHVLCYASQGPSVQENLDASV